MNDKHALRQMRKDLFISVLAIFSVAIGIYDLTHPRMTARFTPLDVLDLIIAGIFNIDFFYSAVSSGNWKNYLKQHWYEIPALLPVTGNMVKGAEAVPLLRGMRLVRLVRVLRLLRAVGTIGRLRNSLRTAGRIARHAHISGLIIFFTVMVLVGAGLAWLMEASINEHFRGGDAIWWALNMFTNVAYVDFQPVTTGGHVIAAILQICGIAFIGLFTASLATALLTDVEDEEDADHRPLD